LPRSYYALGEQRAGNIGPDVLTLHSDIEPISEAAAAPNEVEGMIAVAEAPPRVRLSQEADEAQFYLAHQRSVVIRHVSGDRVVAFIEIVSPANKHSPQTVEDFATKVGAALRDSIHVLVLDPFPPGNRDPRGMHGAVWAGFATEPYEQPEGLPLTLVSYRATAPAQAYIEPIRVGTELIDMPLFLASSHYIETPLESTYQRAWRGVPQRWRRVIEENGAQGH
jgi:hypothetical protein